MCQIHVQYMVVMCLSRCRHGFVRADRILLLRELLDKLSSTAGLVNEEKGALQTLIPIYFVFVMAETPPPLPCKSDGGDRCTFSRWNFVVWYCLVLKSKINTIRVFLVLRVLKPDFCCRIGTSWGWKWIGATSAKQDSGTFQGFPPPPPQGRTSTTATRINWMLKCCREVVL